MKCFVFLLTVLGTLGRADADVLFAATAAGGPGELYTLDPATGAVIQDIGPINDTNNVNYPITGLAFQPGTGSLWGSTGNKFPATAATLVKIDPTTGQAIVIGPFNVGNGATMTDLAFDANGV